MPTNASANNAHRASIFAPSRKCSSESQPRYIAYAQASHANEDQSALCDYFANRIVDERARAENEGEYQYSPHALPVPAY